MDTVRNASDIVGYKNTTVCNKSNVTVLGMNISEAMTFNGMNMTKDGSPSVCFVRAEPEYEITVGLYGLIGSVLLAVTLSAGEL
jgi:hypothetical protein